MDRVELSRKTMANILCYIDTVSHLSQLHPDFHPLAVELLEVLQDFCEDAGCTYYIASSWRSPGRQMELYKRGRKKVGKRWIRIPGTQKVTNAMPHQTPHCVTRDGEPASCALDIALVDKGAWLKDYDQRWSLIPAAASVVSPLLVSGGFFRGIRDFPHVELQYWKQLQELE